jgi:hypothetical protein
MKQNNFQKFCQNHWTLLSMHILFLLHTVGGSNRYKTKLNNFFFKCDINVCSVPNVAFTPESYIVYKCQLHEKSTA